MISLPFPPSMNRLWRAGKNGRVYRSDTYEKWRVAAAWDARMQSGPQKISGPFKITIRFVRPDARHRDLDNLLKAVLDCLQHAGVIDNDKNCAWIDAAWTAVGAPCVIKLDVMNGENIDQLSNSGP